MGVRKHFGGNLGVLVSIYAMGMTLRLPRNQRILPPFDITDSNHGLSAPGSRGKGSNYVDCATAAFDAGMQHQSSRPYDGFIS